ncbi:MAG: MFS transporter [Proteobacteria bacterium]|nr:MFS transporter [Pseudomonadota bacterium]
MPRSDPAHFPPIRVALAVWGLGAGLYLIGFFQRVAPAVITHELMAEFALSAMALGNLSALYFYTYVAIQIPTGVLVDHWGPRRVLAAGGLLAAAGTLVFSQAGGYALVGAGRLFVGAGVGVAFVAMLKLATHWIQPSRFALVSGLALACGSIGGVSAGVPLRMAVDAFGWRWVMLAAAVVTAVLAVVTWLFVRDDPRERGYLSFSTADPGARPRHSMLGGIREVFRYRNVWLNFIGCGAITGPMLAFGGLWGVPFLVSQYGMSTGQAAFVTSVMLVAWAVGSPIAGALSDRLHRRKLPILAGGSIAVLLWAVLIYLPGLPYWLLVALMIGLGLASGVVVIGFAFCKESAPAALAGTASGVANMGNMLGGMAMQPLIGWLLDLGWDGTMAGDVRAYGFSAYAGGFTLMLVWLVAGLAAFGFARETHAKQSA